MTNPYKQRIDTELQQQLQMIQTSLEQKASAFTPPPAHPLSAPLNLGTHDPKLRHVKDTLK